MYSIVAQTLQIHILGDKRNAKACGIVLRFNCKDAGITLLVQGDSAYLSYTLVNARSVNALPETRTDLWKTKF